MTTQDKIIKNKLGVLKRAQTLGSVYQACKVMGYSRGSYYRFKDLYETGGEAALQELTRPNPSKRTGWPSRLSRQWWLSLSTNPPMERFGLATNYAKKVSSFHPVVCVRSGCGTNAPASRVEVFAKRLKALEAKVAQKGLVLTESQLKAMEKDKEEQLATGKIETIFPGYLGSRTPTLSAPLKE